MSDNEKTRYSADELNEFEELITNKLNKAKEELKYIKSTITRSGDSGTDGTSGNVKVLEDGADTMEKKV